MPGPASRHVEELNRAGLAAAVAVAAQQGLPTDDPRILSGRGNLVVHLAPAPVVARVATLTAWTRNDPFRWLAHEVAVADYVATHGGPAVAPAALADPGPHRSNGLAVSLWNYLPPSERRPGPAAVGEALARLHLATVGFPGQLTVMSGVRAQVTEGLAALERAQALNPDVLAALRARHAEVLAELDGAGGDQDTVLHGDAHAGNLLCAGTWWLWVDLEETCRGPREFDLAVVARHQGTDGAATLAAYAAALGGPVPRPADLAPFDRARDLEGAVWTLGMAHQYPDRYREPARALLASVLGDGKSPPAS